MLSVIMMIICLVKAKMGINDETITKSTKIVSIIECTINLVFILFKVAGDNMEKQDIIKVLIWIVILMIGINIKKIKIAVLDSHFRGE